MTAAKVHVRICPGCRLKMSANVRPLTMLCTRCRQHARIVKSKLTTEGELK